MRAASQFTVFGARGWIGGAMIRYLSQRGHSVRAIHRSNWPDEGEHLGHVIYAIGITSDFANQALATMESHVSLLVRILRSFRLDSFLYLSAARVYKNISSSHEEAALHLRSVDPDDFYCIAKVAAEATCLMLPRPTIRVARLSNIVGPGPVRPNFLPTLLEEVRTRGATTMLTTPDSAKDYIGLDDAAAVLESIALGGRHRIYNVASGRNTENRVIAGLIEKHLSAPVSFAPDAQRIIYPVIAIDRIREEFGIAPAPFEDAFSQLIQAAHV